MQTNETAGLRHPHCHHPQMPALNTILAPLHRVLAWRPGGYARDGARIFGWLLLRAVAQAATVLMLARWLGASGYGAFVAALAVASFFTPLAGLGLGGVLLVRGARAPGQLPALQARAASIWAASAVAFTVLATAAMAWSLPAGQPLWALVALAAAEVAGASWVELQARSAQALRQPHRFGAIQAGLPLMRLFALAAIMSLAPPDPAVWMAAYAVASLLYVGGLALQHAAAQPTPPHALPAANAITLLRDGLPFAGGAVALRLQAEFNKPVLAQMDYALAGNFSAAQRAVELATLPLAALQEALWPRIYASDDPNTRLRRSGAVLVLLSLASGALLAAFAPLLPWLLGEGYAPAAQTMAALALLPAVQMVRNLGNAWLIANGASQSLYLVYAAAAATGALLALLLVPRFSLTGAVWALYGSEAVAIGVQLVTSLRKGR